MRRAILLPLIALLSVTTSVTAHGQDWSRYDEAANLVARGDTSLYLDSVRLERVRAALERSRAAFPELRRIRADGAGIELYLSTPFNDPGAAAVLRRQTLGPEQPRAWGRWREIASTGLAAVDSLNRRFGAVRVLARVDSATGTMPALPMIVVMFERPMNVERLETLYEAAGVATDMWSRHLTTWHYPWVGWTPGDGADELQFRLDTDCMDDCRRKERYVVRVPHDGGAVRMVERDVRINPDGRGEWRAVEPGTPTF